MKSNYTLDSLDYKILRELQRNAREKVSTIATNLNIPATTVHLRITRMEDAGIIKGYVPVLDRKKIGKPLMALVEIMSYSDVDMREAIEELKKIKNIISLYSITGASDGFAIVVGKDIDEINDTVVEMRRAKVVKETETKIVLDSIKEFGKYPLPEM